MRTFALLAVWATLIVQAVSAVAVLTCSGNNFNPADGLLVTFEAEVHQDIVSFSGSFPKPDSWNGYSFGIIDFDGNHQFTGFQGPSEVSYYQNLPADKRGTLQQSYFSSGISTVTFSFNIVPTSGASSILVYFYSADLSASSIPARFLLSCNYVEPSSSVSSSTEESSSSSSEEESSSSSSEEESSSSSSEEESSSSSSEEESSSSSSEEESSSSIESSSSSYLSSTESTSSSESSTSSTSSSESSSVSAIAPSVTGFIQDGVPVFELTIPGSLGPWSSVTLSGSASGFVFHSGQFDVDGISVEDQLNLDDLPTFTASLDNSIDLGQSLGFVLDTIATTTGPFTFTGRVQITTEDPVQIYQKREDLSWDLEFTINDFISSSSSSIQSSSSAEISSFSESSSISSSISSSLSSSASSIPYSISPASSFSTVSSSSFAGYNSSTSSLSPISSFDVTSVPSKTTDISVITLTDTHSIIYTLTVTVPCETVTTTNPAGKTVTQVITKVCTTNTNGEITTSTRTSELVLTTSTNLVGAKTTVTLTVPCSYCTASKDKLATTATETNSSPTKATTAIGSISIPTKTVISTGTVVTSTNAVVSTFAGAGVVLTSGLGLSGFVALLFVL